MPSNKELFTILTRATLRDMVAMRLNDLSQPLSVHYWQRRTEQRRATYAGVCLDAVDLLPPLSAAPAGH
eukprot:1159640-Pelagomonas_calceolata.AAC.13